MPSPSRRQRPSRPVVSKELIIKANKGEWVRIDAPLAKFKIKDGKFDTLSFNNASPRKLDELYINYVLLHAQK
jgi:hypothetical protein